MRQYYVDATGQVVFTLQRMAFQWCTLIIVVYQGGRGKLLKVIKPGGERVPRDDSPEARKARALASAEEQHPDCMPGLLPAGLAADLNARLTADFHFSDNPAEIRQLEPFSTYGHLFVAVFRVSCEI